MLIVNNKGGKNAYIYEFTGRTTEIQQVNTSINCMSARFNADMTLLVVSTINEVSLYSYTNDSIPLEQVISINENGLNSDMSAIITLDNNFILTGEMNAINIYK